MKIQRAQEEAKEEERKAAKKDKKERHKKNKHNKKAKAATGTEAAATPVKDPKPASKKKNFECLTSCRFARFENTGR